jgi:hypothetical protein
MANAERCLGDDVRLFSARQRTGQFDWANGLSDGITQIAHAGRDSWLLG